MRFHIVTIFPNMFESYFAESIISRAIENKLIEVHTYALRDFTVDKHRRVDGRPYGGGPGMVMWVDPLLRCVEHIVKKQETRSKKQGGEKLKTKNLSDVADSKLKTRIVIFSPGGKEFTNTIAKLSVKKYTDIIFICGRYEGIDARVKKILKAEEWSIGNYILTGGELPAMVCVDAIARQVQGVLHAEDSVEENRIASHEVYARPEIYEYKGKKYKVPKVLLSGNHKEIDAYRTKKENKIGKQEAK
jgi:tRNA (guanine37-N1)-methyltransferase